MGVTGRSSRRRATRAARARVAAPPVDPPVAFEVEIDRVVLLGFERLDVGAVGDAIHEELTRLLAIPEGLRPAAAVSNDLVRTTIELAPGARASRADALGTQLARALPAAIRGEPKRGD